MEMHIFEVAGYTWEYEFMYETLYLYNCPSPNLIIDISLKNIFPI